MSNISKTIIIYPNSVRHVVGSAFDVSKTLRKAFHGALNSGFVGLKADAVTLHDNKTAVSCERLRDLFPGCCFEEADHDMVDLYDVEGLGKGYQNHSKVFVASPA